MTLTEFQEKKESFITHLEIERHLSTHTIRAYESDLRTFIDFWQHRLTKEEQTKLSLRQIIERYLVSLFYKKIDKQTIARKYSSFTSFAKFLKTYGIDLNINLKRPRLDKKLPIYLSVDEVFHLLDTIADNELPSQHPVRDKAIFELLYATGIRCCELVTIKLRDIDMQQKTIRILGKGNQERMVLFGEKAKRKIQEYLLKERGPILTTDEPLLLNRHRKQMTTRSIQRVFEMFRTCLKMDKHITPHKIRHSFATHLLNQGVDLRVVQELLGHKTIASTEKYTHISLDELSRMCNEIHPINKILKK